LIISCAFVFIGTLTSVFSTMIAMSKKIKTNLVTFQEEEEEDVVKQQEKLPLTTTEPNFVPEKTKLLIFRNL